MRIVVIGGTGLVGAKLVRRLAALGHNAAAASPTTGVNTITRLGLAAALCGTDVVVDTGDAPSYDDEAVLDYFVKSGLNLARAELAAGVTHHITLSIVGAQRLTNSGYMRAKVAQEAVTRAAGIPYTILRSTQSFELMRAVADNTTIGDVVRVSPSLVQPVAAEDIAATIADIAGERPIWATQELAGPAPIRLIDLVAEVLLAQRDARRAEAAADAAYCGSRLDDRTLMPDRAARLGTTRFTDWLNHALERHESPPASAVDAHR